MPNLSPFALVTRTLVEAPALEALVLLDELLGVGLGGVVVLLLVVRVVGDVGHVVEVEGDPHGPTKEGEEGNRHIGPSPLVRGVEPATAEGRGEEVGGGGTPPDGGAAEEGHDDSVPRDFLSKSFDSTTDV